MTHGRALLLAMPQRRNILALLLAALAVLTLPAHAQMPASLAETSDEALVLLEMRLGTAQISDALQAQEFDGEVYLPLQQLAAALSIAIQCDPEQGTASGFILDSSRPFYLDARAGTVSIAGKVQNFDTAGIRIGDDDIYLARDLVSAWLPVDLQIDLPGLRLVIEPREPLPLQSRRERERRGEELTRRNAQTSEELPRRTTPYAWIEIPTIDQTVATDARRSGDAFHSQSRSSTFAAGDLLKMEASAYVTASPGMGKPNARLTLSRHDPDGDLLGFARRAAIGSVPIAGVASISDSSSLGTGALISNYPLTRPERFDTQTLTGPLPPGWDVELYYNDALADWRQADETGIYDFADVPLQYGRNEFRLVFRGPQGQFREENRSFQVGESLAPAGTVYYRAAAHPWANDGITGLTQFDWGLTSRVSLAGGLSWLEGDNTPYANVGVRSALAGMFLTADLIHSPDGDWAREVGLRTRVGSLGVTLTHAQLDGFESDVYEQGTEQTARSTLRLDGGVSMLGVRLPLAIQLQRDQLPGADTLQGRARVGALLGGFALAHQLDWYSDQTGNLFTGTLQMTRRFDRFGLRALMTYDPASADFVQNVAMSLEQRAANGWLWSVGVDHSMAQQESLLSASLNRSFSSFSLGARAGWSTADQMSVGLTLFSSLGREPRDGEWQVDRAPVADSGAVSARAFVDSNVNGEYDDGEQLLEDVAFQVNGGRQQARSGDRGVALLRRLPVNQFVSIGIVRDSLEDPYWVPSPVGIRVVPRAGKVLIIDFPVIPATEIDGTLYLETANGQQVLGGRTIELRAADGTVIASTQSSSDGYYVLTAVPPGNWQMIVVTRDGEIAPPPRIVNIDPDGSFGSGIDLVVTTPEALAAAAVAAAAAAAANTGSEAVADAAQLPSAADAGSTPADLSVEQAQFALQTVQTVPTVPTVPMTPKQASPQSPAPNAERLVISKPPRSGSAAFAVQAGSFANVENAERYAMGLVEIGYEPRIEEYVDPYRKRWYRVRLGSATDLGEALAAVNALRKIHPDAIPVTDFPER